MQQTKHSAREAGTEEKYGTLAFRIPESLKWQLRRRAAEAELSLQKYLLRVLEEAAATSRVEAA